MERLTIVSRLQSGYSAHRKAGGSVGRKLGVKVKTEEQFLMENKDVIKLLRQGFSVRKIMKLAEKSSGTIQKVKKLVFI
jgi:DNA invertase Pin-like site-specific DNA recombinase